MHLSETPFAEQNKQCVPSSCGHIHDISYPFRLKSDPKHCGHENYELSCEGNHTILDGDESNYHIVQAINYDNSTIHLVDPDIREKVVCSLPKPLRSAYSSLLNRFTTWRRRYLPSPSHVRSVPISLVETITVFSCPFPINSPDIVEITSCLNRSYASSGLFRGHRYATMAELSPSDLKVGCSVDLMSMTSWHNYDANANSSILSLHKALAYGFELSWFQNVYCDKCPRHTGRNSYQSCEGENSRNVRCVEISYGCDYYNFRFFKTPDCCKNIPYVMLEFKTLLAILQCKS
ncbi:uncharacterized protein LOC132032414 [Lycium ferocissimum]|uniref:uncharacterized protein LOC132032414 n=1 Tax=Lycium ferocissimum TaxID=112874 RepID=UPI0028167C4E|nr:uncharacterized protein LOC132032414 [Lycium ferocissimum]